MQLASKIYEAGDIASVQELYHSNGLDGRGCRSCRDAGGRSKLV